VGLLERARVRGTVQLDFVSVLTIIAVDEEEPPARYTYTRTAGLANAVLRGGEGGTIRKPPRMRRRRVCAAAAAPPSVC
jgi:hypothetical protein